MNSTNVRLKNKIINNKIIQKQNANKKASRKHLKQEYNDYCNEFRQFHVLHFDGPSFSYPSFSVNPNRPTFLMAASQTPED